jgi:H/ACA ribonucleoprotein complex subunit 4
MKLPFESRKPGIVELRKTKYSHHVRDGKELLEYGVVNLDKPSGPTSTHTVNIVKDILGVGKAGHSGTLDPKVTGVLPVGLNEATKILGFLLKAGKEYVCLMHLHREVGQKVVLDAMKSFVGRNVQLPPLRSHVKRQEREREVYYIKPLELDGKDVLFTVGCEAGTYIRRLCDDIGKELGVGAHMQELRRTKAGPFSEDMGLVTLQRLKEVHTKWKDTQKEGVLTSVIQPIERSVTHLPHIWITEPTVDSVCHGATLKVPGVAKLHDDVSAGSNVALISPANELVAVGLATMDADDISSSNQGVVATLERVVMRPGTYQRMW